MMDFDSDEKEFLAEAERRAKQDFLREEVLDKGYDPVHFVTFCNTLRGSNVDLWTFDELQMTVKEFKLAYRRGDFDTSEAKSSSSSHSSSSSIEGEGFVVGGVIEAEGQMDGVGSTHKPDESKPIGIDAGARESLTTPVPLSVSTPVVVSSEPAVSKSPSHIAAVYRVPCRTAGKSQLTTDALPHVEVTDPQVVTHSMFSKSYANYLVITSPFGWTVRRRYSDFEWLRKVLCEHFPGRFVRLYSDPSSSAKHKSQQKC
jgi:sorting nexin-7/30/sorting nexin-8